MKYSLSKTAIAALATATLVVGGPINARQQSPCYGTGELDSPCAQASAAMAVDDAPASAAIPNDSGVPTIYAAGNNGDNNIVPPIYAAGNIGDNNMDDAQPANGGYNSEVNPSNGGNQMELTTTGSDNMPPSNNLDTYGAAGEAGLNDVGILQVALALEHLENEFYKAGLQNFTESDFAALSDTPDDFYTQLQKIQAHEQSHVDFLTEALGPAAVEACAYTFPVSNAEQFLRQAAIFESFGVSAYLGAADLLTGRANLATAANILSVEAQHNAFLQESRNMSPFQTFVNTPLTPDQVYTIASRYFAECPGGNEQIPVTAAPLLTPVNATTPLSAGGQVELRPADSFAANGQQLYAAFPTREGYLFSDVSQSDNGYTANIPEGLQGQSYVVLTNQNGVVSDESTVAGPAVLPSVA